MNEITYSVSMVPDISPKYFFFVDFGTSGDFYNRNYNKIDAGSTKEDIGIEQQLYEIVR